MEPAERARTRGGHAAASAALERAADLSSDPAATGRRLTAAAVEALMAGHGPRAGKLADRAAGLVTDAALRAELDYTRARVEAGAGNRRIGFELMVGAADETEDAASAARMLAEAGRLAWMEADPRMMVEVGRRMDALPLQDGAPERYAVDLMKALFRLLQGDAGGAGALIGSIEGVDRSDPAQLHLAGVASMFMRDDRTARELLAGALSRARAAGSVALLPRILVPVALLETWEGSFAAARAHASEGERLARDTGHARPAHPAGDTDRAPRRRGSVEQDGRGAALHQSANRRVPPPQRVREARDLIARRAHPPPWPRRRPGG